MTLHVVGSLSMNLPFLSPGLSVCHSADIDILLYALLLLISSFSQPGIAFFFMFINQNSYLNYS